MSQSVVEIKAKYRDETWPSDPEAGAQAELHLEDVVQIALSEAGVEVHSVEVRHR